MIYLCSLIYTHSPGSSPVCFEFHCGHFVFTLKKDISYDVIDRQIIVIINSLQMFGGPFFI